MIPVERGGVEDEYRGGEYELHSAKIGLYFEFVAIGHIAVVEQHSLIII